MLGELERVMSHRAGTARDQHVLAGHAAVHHHRVIGRERRDAEARTCGEVDPVRQRHRLR
jgi:hypothetical protein